MEQICASKKMRFKSRKQAYEEEFGRKEFGDEGGMMRSK